LLSSTLISHGLLSSVAGLKPDINRKPYALSHLADSAHSVSDNPLSRDLTINAKSDPTALAEVPIIANISSTQGSLAYAAELFNGGANRDDLIFHPIYASVKGALSAMTLNLARELRVSANYHGWNRSLTILLG
jgi:NAD(P)-dependent dehydrogenase (short-subunit alcohol dehydrogenase family)